jgi:protein O-mannosyl-transferase
LISFGILWFFLALSVESSLIPIIDTIFEHRLYLPSFGAAAAFGTAFFMLAEKFCRSIGDKLPLLVAAMLLLSFSLATIQRNQVWGNDIRLWEDVVRKSPQKGRPHNELGFALENAGRRAEAVEAFHRALAVDPYYYRAYYNLGELYLVSGRPDAAVPMLERVITLKPELSEAYVKLAAALIRGRNFREAAIFLEQNLDRVGENGEARFYLGAAYAFLGNREAARRELTVLSRLDPGLASDLAGLLGRDSTRMSSHEQQSK